MEIFLLLVDDLDDLFHALRMVLPKIVGLLIALGIFSAVVISAMAWPWMLLSGALLAGVMLAVRSAVRSLGLAQLKTDP